MQRKDVNVPWYSQTMYCSWECCNSHRDRDSIHNLEKTSLCLLGLCQSTESELSEWHSEPPHFFVLRSQQYASLGQPTFLMKCDDVLVAWPVTMLCYLV